MTKPQSAQVKANIYLDESGVVYFCPETLSHAVKVSEALYVCLLSVLRLYCYLSFKLGKSQNVADFSLSCALFTPFNTNTCKLNIHPLSA